MSAVFQKEMPHKTKPISRIVTVVFIWFFEFLLYVERLATATRLVRVRLQALPHRGAAEKLLATERRKSAARYSSGCAVTDWFRALELAMETGVNTCGKIYGLFFPHPLHLRWNSALALSPKRLYEYP